MCGNYAPLLKLILEQLNFTILWVQAKDHAFGHLDTATGKWNGLLGLLQNNEAQISPCWHFMTSSKWIDFDFSNFSTGLDKNCRSLFKLKIATFTSSFRNPLC